MKNWKYLVGIISLVFGVLACEDDWDNHYSKENAVIDNAEITIASGSSMDYLRGQESYSKFSQLLEKSGIAEQLKTKSQAYTILAIDNDMVDALSIVDTAFWAKTYITNVALSPSSLEKGQRILMWNGKYLEVDYIQASDKENTLSLTFNKVKVGNIVKTDDGYIYKLTEGFNILQSMYEVIQNLDDKNYSTFKRLLSVFNKEASTPVGVDKDGNTVYDSVFVVSSPEGFDLTSESIKATMLIPSNEVIAEAMSIARRNLESWRVSRADSIIENWIYQAMFFKTEYAPEDFEANVDLTSAYGKQWRTTVQEVDLDHPLPMSNGVAYYVTKLKIPNNVLIYRLKDYYYYYEYMSDEEKALYFKEKNLTFQKCSTIVAGWTPSPGVWPLHENRVIRYGLTDVNSADFSLEFTPVKCSENADGSYHIEPYTIPPGEYRLCMGFAQGMPANIEVYFSIVNDGAVMSTVKAGEVGVAQLSQTTYHYDRDGEGYAEGYNPDEISHKKNQNYDRDGGFIGIVTVPIGDAHGVKITVKGTSTTQTDKTVQTFHHWCLRPTSDNY